MRTLLLCALLGASLSAQAQRLMVIRGCAQLPKDATDPCNIMLMTACGDTLAMEQTRSGRFKYHVPRNGSYLLRFAQAGSVTKEVVVDASELPRMRMVYYVRQIEFDVRMEAGDPMQHWHYARPAGFISFHRGSGKIQVLYDHTSEELVKAE